jgi:diacylglycerol kinase family enzyme
MPGIGIITNPHSRRNRRYPEQMRRLAYILGQRDAHELTNRIEDVLEVARRFRDDDIEILALNGGDGTNHVTLTRFIEVYGDKPLPKIALLRGGTMNTVSEAVGIKGTPSRLLANLVEKYYTRQPFETTKRDMLKITDEHGTNYGFIFGNGIISNFLEIYYKSGDPSPKTAALLLGRAIAQVATGGDIIDKLFEPFNADVTFGDGESWPARDYKAVMAATVDQIGLGFRPFIRCEEREGTFHVLAITAGPLGTAAMLPRMRLGLPVHAEGIRGKIASQALFRSDTPIHYTIDGDMHTAQSGQVRLEAGPRVELIIK